MKTTTLRPLQVQHLLAGILHKPVMVRVSYGSVLCLEVGAISRTRKRTGTGKLYHSEHGEFSFLIEGYWIISLPSKKRIAKDSYTDAAIDQWLSTIRNVDLAGFELNSKLNTTTFHLSNGDTIGVHSDVDAPEQWFVLWGQPPKVITASGKGVFTLEVKEQDMPS